MKRLHRAMPVAMSMVLLGSSVVVVASPETAAQSATAAPAKAERQPDQTASRGAPRTIESLDVAVLPPEGTAYVDYAGPTTTTTVVKSNDVTPKVTKSSPKVTEVSHETSVVASVASSPASGSVVDIALAQIGKAYRAGAVGPNAFDCSGLVYFVFNQAGIHIPRMSSDGYYASYPHVSKADLQPGDVVVYPGHIAIYVGDGQIVSASTPRGGVKHYGMSNPGSIIGYARIS